MEWYESLSLLLGTIVLLMAIGMPVALAFLAANILGAWIFMGGERGVMLLLNNGFGALTAALRAADLATKDADIVRTALLHCLDMGRLQTARRLFRDAKAVGRWLTAQTCGFEDIGDDGNPSDLHGV